MSTSSPATPLSLADEGLRETAQISHPIVRRRHEAAWAYRLSALEPERALELFDAVRQDPEQRGELLLTNLRDRLRRGEKSLDKVTDRYLPLLLETEAVPTGAQLQILNAISEFAIEVADHDREAALRMLKQLVPVVESLRALPSELPDTSDMSDTQSLSPQHYALGCALLGEALFLLDETEGRALLLRGLEAGSALPAADSITVFVANALAERDPAAAVALLQSIEDPGTRLEARLQLAPKVNTPALLETLFDGAEAEAALIAHQRGPEVLVRLGQALASHSLERAQPLFEEALSTAASADPQYRALQLAGVASALDSSDPPQALNLYQQAVESATASDEVSKQVTAMVLIANEMAEFHPREASETFQRAMTLAEGLEALWEFSHVLELAFRTDRSPYLDLAPARPLLERVLDRLSDEDPRIPGVFGIPDAARYWMQIDQERGIEVLRRWLRVAEAAGDSDGMTHAAVAIYEADPEAGRRALTQVRDSLLRRVDCPAMGDFSRSAAAVAPDLVESLAPIIPDRRERTDALTLAAIHRYDADPDAALAVMRGLGRPADRSLALMQLVDRLAGTGDRPLPQPLLEELP